MKVAFLTVPSFKIWKKSYQECKECFLIDLTSNTQCGQYNTMELTPNQSDLLPRWRQSQRQLLGRNGGTVVKVITAAVFLMTIASILSGNVLDTATAGRQELDPKSQNNGNVQAALPILFPPPAIPGLETYQSNDSAQSQQSTTSTTVSTYIQDKIAAWKLWHSASTFPTSMNTSQQFNDNTTWHTPSDTAAAVPLSELTLPAPSSSFPIRPTILKLSMLTSWEQSAYERALATHSRHATVHSYPFHILRTPILSDIWSKPAYILSILLRELAKSPGERAQWLWWFDADTIILNKLIPLEAFLPPANLDDINLLVGHDWNGLNNGVYPLRVHPWSVELLTTILTYPIYKPEEPLPLRDQTAMANILQMPRFKRHTAIVPMRWFNGYHRVINESAEGMMAKPGDLLVHLAGVPDRFAVMEEWLRKVDGKEVGFEVEYQKLPLQSEIRTFWKEFEEGRKKAEAEIQELKTVVEDLEKEFKKLVEEGAKVVHGEAVKMIEQLLERKKKVFDDFYGKQDVELVRSVTEQVKEVSGMICHVYLLLLTYMQAVRPILASVETAPHDSIAPHSTSQ